MEHENGLCTVWIVLVKNNSGTFLLLISINLQVTEFVMVGISEKQIFTPAIDSPIWWNYKQPN